MPNNKSGLYTGFGHVTIKTERLRGSKAKERSGDINYYYTTTTTTTTGENRIYSVLNVFRPSGKRRLEVR